MAAKYAGPDGRAALVERMLRDRSDCETCPRIHTVDDRIRCGLDVVDVHELLARSAGGSILDEANCVTTCRVGHDWIGKHPKEAITLGLRLSRYDGRNPTKDTDDDDDDHDPITC